VDIGRIGATSGTPEYKLLSLGLERGTESVGTPPGSGVQPAYERQRRGRPGNLTPPMFGEAWCGDRAVTLPAMKPERAVEFEHAGTVDAIRGRKGEEVARGVVMARVGTA
jgi:biotin carboxyl carrier protein